MNNPLVSVIVLTYNNLIYFDRCINSILEQTYDNIELIISDDCSKQFDKCIYEQHIKANKSNNIVNYKIVSNNINLGTVKNFNNAIKISNGKYIIPLAVDDCFYDKNVVTCIVKKFINQNCLILTGYRKVYNNDGTIEKIFPKKRHIKVLKSYQDKLYKKLCKENFISGSCTSYSRQLFSRYGFFDEKYRLLEDYPKYLQITRNHEKIYFIDKIIIEYTMGGVSSSPNPILKKDFNLTIKNEILPYKNLTGTFMNRLKKFEYLRSISKRFKCKLLVSYLDIVIYKIINKIIKRCFNNL
ncbi:glycosyltransferase [Clostridium autoethanogenum]|uniref:Glycosyltransferase n=1 Tax=Clostridium autoethanogenum DSM 10061 TaxID=1341692 RepID=A0ABN4BGN5_9CLOT|nr:glycosyltransferase [Clostridium autoethanogenum]AGY76815.1 glycosyltransferase [Clostridium autoethanogenum DSM 10061]ALU36967.1 Glycosyl transferase family 2 [Clostridium autoethanogenum DSM 10061]OVY50343.1 putative glycosyltransferase EpsJ [Clostridium autoethanogenum]